MGMKVLFHIFFFQILDTFGYTYCLMFLGASLLLFCNMLNMDHPVCVLSSSNMVCVVLVLSTVVSGIGHYCNSLFFFFSLELWHSSNNANWTDSLVKTPIMAAAKLFAALFLKCSLRIKQEGLKALNRSLEQTGQRSNSSFE